MRTHRIRRICTITLLATMGLTSVGIAHAAQKDATTDHASSTSRPVKPPKPARPATAWARLTDGISEQGFASKRIALRAFALTVGELPGIDAPTGAKGGTSSATGALRWIGAHLDELTPAQHDAVSEALQPVDIDGRPASAWAEPTSSIRGVARSAPVRSPVGCWDEEVVLEDAPGAAKYRGVLDQELAALETHLGPLGIPVNLVFSPADGKAYAMATAYNEDCSEPASACTIRLMPKGLALPAGELRFTFAHELAHCFQSRVVPISEARKRASWVVEGFAEWAGSALHPGGSKDTTLFWKDYLTTPQQSLFSRAYDAVGFYSHVDETGGDPWSTFTAAMSATENMDAFDAIVGSSRARFSETWGSGYAREPERGTAWDEVAPAIPASKPPIADAFVRNGDTRTLGADEVTNLLARVTFAADIVQIGVDGERLGRVSWDGGADSAIADVTDDLYCARTGGCICPEGDSPDTRPIPAQAALLAVTGTDASSQVSIAGSSLDDFCKDGPGTNVTTSSQDTLDRCLVGRWVSNDFEIPSIVPGYSSTGGSGAAVTVRSNGSVVWDFTDMEPMVSHDEQIGVTTAVSSSGGASGQVTATGGTWHMTKADTSGVTGHLSDTVLGDRSIPGGPGVYVMIGDGTYSCGGDSITYNSVDPVEHSTVTVRLTRA